MGYTNSGLVAYKKLSPNHSGLRTHSIDRITPHCVVGQCIPDEHAGDQPGAGAGEGGGRQERALHLPDMASASWHGGRGLQGGETHPAGSPFREQGIQDA